MTVETKTVVITVDTRPFYGPPLPTLRMLWIDYLVKTSLAAAAEFDAAMERLSAALSGETRPYLQLLRGLQDGQTNEGEAS